MGDRANVVIREEPEYVGEKEAVFLYSHWGGTNMPNLLREALDSDAGRGRWGDPAYLARIVFEHMIRGEMGEPTGYGIGTHPPDNEHDLLVLLPHEMKLIRYPETIWAKEGFSKLDQHPSISFEDYVAVGMRTWDTLTDAAADLAENTEPA